MTVRVTGGDTAVEYRPAERRLVVERDGETLLDGRLDLDVGGETLPATGEATVDASDGAARAVHESAWETTVDLDAGDGHVDVRVSLRAPRDGAAVLGDLRPLADATAPTHGPRTRRYRHGYQS
ncbi:hypothetical protein [Halomicrococcus sp. NG-SE-24]|uniref:hypothetical protein n=1 Tax=Halomicrococcus sp. NG-SE-24 TaxID=3436928 RepID=UPI003D99C311